MSSSPNPAPIRLLLVDDSVLVRQGVKTILSDDARIEIVGEAGTVADAIEDARRTRPDVVLLDIRLPDGSGLNAGRAILRELPGTRVLVLTSFANDDFICDAVTAGVHGYLMKEIDPVGLIEAIKDVASGRSILAPDVTSRVLRLLRSNSSSLPAPTTGDLSSLSGQERRVLALVAEGKTNKEVGEQLNLSENTVKNYLVSVFDKLRVKRRSQAAALYAQVVADTKAEAKLDGVQP